MEKEKKTPVFKTFGVPLRDVDNADVICDEVYDVLVNHKLNIKEARIICKIVITALDDIADQTELED